MNTAELKKLAEAATQSEWQKEGRTVYSLMHHGWHKGEEQFKNRFWMPAYKSPECPEEELEANVAFIAAANPAAILELLAINAELAEALKNLLNDTQHSEHFCGDPNCPVANAIAALAKAEGGEL